MATAVTGYGLGSTKDNPDIKFLQLRKTRVSNDEIPVDVSSGIAVSNQHNLMFVMSSTSRIEILDVNTLLDYEWSRNLMNQESLATPITAFNCKSRICFISVSLKENILSVAAVNGSSLELYFFNIPVIAATNTATPFARITVSGSGVTSLEWHPDEGDSLLILTTKEGKAVSMKVSSTDSTAVILAELVTSVPLMSASWSPKGKQVAFCNRNGCVTFYKHFNGSSFTEARIIHPPNDLPGFSASSIKWILSSLLLVTFVKKDDTDPDTRFCLLSAPIKANPEVIDFGRICFDLTEVTNLSDYFTSFVHIKNNLVLAYSSHANELSVLGYEGDEKAASATSSWNQFILDDDKRIELPLTQNSSDTFPRGVSVVRSTTREMKISQNEKYGGSNTPCLFVLTSEGVICCYYVVTGPDSVENIPTQVTSLPKQVSPVKSDSVAATLGSLSFCPATHSTPQNKGNANPFAPKGSLFSSTTSSTEGKPPAAPVLTSLLKPSVKDVALDAVQEEMKSMSSLMQDHKRKMLVWREKWNKSLDLNSFPSFDSMAGKRMEEEVKQIQETLTDFKVDNEALTGWILQNNASLVESKSKIDRIHDEKRTQLQSKCPLDPLTERKMKSVLEKKERIERQLEAATQCLSMNWESLLESQNRLPSTKFMSKKDKQKNHLETIRKTIEKQECILQVLSQEVSHLEDRIRGGYRSSSSFIS